MLDRLNADIPKYADLSAIDDHSVLLSPAHTRHHPIMVTAPNAETLTTKPTVLTEANPLVVPDHRRSSLTVNSLSRYVHHIRRHDGRSIRKCPPLRREVVPTSECELVSVCFPENLSLHKCVKKSSSQVTWNDLKHCMPILLTEVSTTTSTRSFVETIDVQRQKPAATLSIPRSRSRKGKTDDTVYKISRS